MSYENTSCPCGDKKPTDTMLCDKCAEHFKERREMSEYQDSTLPFDYRRNAAIVLVTLARGRRRVSV